jgi:hypothetical protein
VGEALTAEVTLAEAELIPQNFLASACAPPFRIPARKVGEAESALGWCFECSRPPQEAQRLLRQSQKKPVSDARPIYQKQASAHLKALAGAKKTERLMGSGAKRRPPEWRQIGIPAE